MKDILRSGVRNPVRVSIPADRAITSSTGHVASEGGIPKSYVMMYNDCYYRLKSMYMIVPISEKLSRLRDVLMLHKNDKVVVFLLTCADVEYVDYVLRSLCKELEPSLYALHGKMHAKKRTGTFSKFSGAQSGILLCTDVAARGLDIKGITFVLQYDAPQDPDFFIHRIGRTARMGENGVALVMLAPHEVSYVDFLSIRKAPLTSFSIEKESNDLEAACRDLNRQDRDAYEMVSVCLCRILYTVKIGVCIAYQSVQRAQM